MNDNDDNGEFWVKLAFLLICLLIGGIIVYYQTKCDKSREGLQRVETRGDGIIRTCRCKGKTAEGVDKCEWREERKP